MILCDPNGTEVPIEELKELSVMLPRVDIAIHWNSAQFKRNRGVFGVDRPTLEMAVSSIKKQHWLIRKQIGRYQWTMLVGRNHNINSNINDFYHLNTPSGQSIFSKCNYTRDELNNFGVFIPTSIVHKQSAFFI